MSKINESLFTNLVSAVTGIALAKKLTSFKSKKPSISSKAAQKLIDKNPKLQKNVKDLQKLINELDKEVAKTISKLSPENQEKMKKLFG